MFWRRLGRRGPARAVWAQAWSGLFSPYQSNPLDINPLRELLEREIDFDALARPAALRCSSSATHVSTGKRARSSAASSSTPTAVMASACLPMLFQAVEIDGEPYWDGGYSANPALAPLIDQCDSARHRAGADQPAGPRHAAAEPHEIPDRVNEITFNASLLTPDARHRLHQPPARPRRAGQAPAAASRCALHRIDGGAAMRGLLGRQQDARRPARWSSGCSSRAGRRRGGWLQQHCDAHRRCAARSTSGATTCGTACQGLTRGARHRVHGRRSR